MLLNEPLPVVVQVRVGAPVVVVLRLILFSEAQITTSVLLIKTVTGLGQAHTLTVNVWLALAVQPLLIVTVTLYVLLLAPPVTIGLIVAVVAPVLHK